MIEASIALLYKYFNFTFSDHVKYFASTLKLTNAANSG